MTTMQRLLDRPRRAVPRHPPQRELEFLRRSAVGLLGLGPGDDVYRYVGERMAELVPGGIVAVNDYDAATNTVRNRALCGAPRRLAVMAALFPVPTAEMRFPLLDEARAVLLTGRLADVPGGLHGFVFEMADPVQCARVERRLGVVGLHAVGFSTGDRLFGNVAIIAASGRPLRDRNLVEAFAQLAAVALQTREARAALRLVEARHARVAANLPGVTYQFVIRRDGSTTFAFVNPKSRDFLGIEASAFERDARRATEVVHPDDRDSLRASIVDSAARCVPWSWTGRVRSADGTERWLQGLSEPVRTPDGDVVFDGVLFDVTDRKRAEQEVEDARAAAEAANRAKTTFLANTSHELRTPLTAVLGMLGLLLKTPLDDRQREFAEVARDSGEELLRLIDDLLDLSRIEAGRLSMQERAFPTAELFAAAMRVAELSAREKGLTLALDVAADVPPVVVGDPGRLRQVLSNVLDNAIKFTAGGGVTVRVDLDTAEGPGAGVPTAADPGEDAGTVRLHFAVLDTGVGIAPALREEVFRPFVQGDAGTARRHGGTGLGLAICHRLVARMGGRIWIEGAAAGGSIVHFTVALGRAARPMEGVDDGAADPPAAGGSSEAATPVSKRGAERLRVPSRTAGRRRRPLRVLVVEDHPAGRLFMSQTLTDLGHDVRAVADGHGALAALARTRRSPFDLVLLDLQLPGLDGLAVLRAVRASRNPAVRGVRVVAVTAHASEEDERRCLAAGMDGFLRKPLREQALLAELARVRRRRARKPNGRATGRGRE